ncbi:ABC transporter ATP-binding protein [Bifidobacterium sp. ESL0682]|uniref:ABC transporter ATP-binding protein n=1 Tax=Bifidobacterium sp. ESL0682 TaxID=2983212 RepID=UPI0023F74D27|nr:ABC transporter ATP-binding protein [Bifidobacterium sp. ESL0682]WEV41836.1 ABC transporter ATP-binding protein [Bifidobacterium sp. ESL0682]
MPQSANLSHIRIHGGNPEQFYIRTTLFDTSRPLTAVTAPLTDTYAPLIHISFPSITTQRHNRPITKFCGSRRNLTSARKVLSMSTLLQAEHLLKFYGNHEAVHDVSLSIERGSLTAVIGPNGAGKSTTISMITGINAPDAGTIKFPDSYASDNHAETGNTNKTEIRKASANNRPAIGVVFQQSVLDHLLTARENLQSRARLYKNLPSNRVKEVIELVHAEDFADQRYGSLSGGQRRSIDIARALINNPDLLVLDEPTTGLDIVTRNSLWSLLNRLRRETGLSILLTTHYLEEAEHADQVYLIDQGHIKASGSAQELISCYADYRLEVTLKPGTSRTAKATLEQLDDNIPVQLPRSVPTTKSQSQQNNAFEEPTSNGNTSCDNPDHLSFTLSSANNCLIILSELRPYITDFQCRPGTMNDVFLALTER